MADSPRRALFTCVALAAGVSVVLGLVFSLRDPTPRRFAQYAGISLLYGLSIGVPATLIFRRLRPAIHRPVLRQWLIYVGVMLAIVLIASLFAGLVLVAVGLVDAAALWPVYRRALAISGALSIPGTIGAVSMSRLYDRLRRSEGEQQRALALAAEARLASLESRVRPHFLFNALNSAIALIPEDPRRAEDLLERLCALLRSSLDADAGLVPLAEELRVVADYLEIERVRFGERLRYELDVPEELGAARVPAFAVQTLVENSVKYAVSPRQRGAHIRVHARRDGDGLAIEISDDGPGFSGPIWRPGHGLDGLRARLLALYGERARLVVPAGAAPGTVPGANVRIELRAEAA